MAGIVLIAGIVISIFILTSNESIPTYTNTNLMCRMYIDEENACWDRKIEFPDTPKNVNVPGGIPDESLLKYK